jgi:lipopolysaccharide biosynthesis glycosyltransferase
MTLVTTVDKNQWKYIFPNINVLESYKIKYKYVIFTSCSFTFVRLKSYVSKLALRYGEVFVENIPNFFSCLGINNVLTPNHSWITSCTMDRLVLPYVTELEKFIYIDVDTLIVSPDVVELWNYPVSERGIAAVPNDVDIVKHLIAFSDNSFLLDVAETAFCTFNAGICVMDAVKLRKGKLIEFTQELYERAGNNIYINDEVILNLYDPNYCLVAEKYNVKAYHVQENGFEPIDEQIIHFSGDGFKPWNCTREINIPILKKYYGLWAYYYYSLFTS